MKIEEPWLQVQAQWQLCLRLQYWYFTTAIMLAVAHWHSLEYLHSIYTVYTQYIHSTQAWAPHPAQCCCHASSGLLGPGVQSQLFLPLWPPAWRGADTQHQACTGHTRCTADTRTYLLRPVLSCCSNWQWWWSWCLFWAQWGKLQDKKSLLSITGIVHQLLLAGVPNQSNQHLTGHFIPCGVTCHV